MKKLRNIFIVLSLILSHMMCIDISYNYANMLCGIRHQGFSAPANIVFLTIIPYGIGITICLILSYVFHKKIKK